MAQSFQSPFPCIPQYTTWPEFNGNLALFYSQELIPLTDEKDWQITARNMMQTPTFSSYSIPNPEIYENWQDWANEFVLKINGTP